MNSEKNDLAQVPSDQFMEVTINEPEAHKKWYYDKSKLVIGTALAGLLLAIAFIQPIQDNPIFSQLGIDRGSAIFITILLLVLIATSGDYSIFDDTDSRR